MKSGVSFTFFLGFFLFIFLNITPLHASVNGFQVNSTELQIYRDGTVIISQKLIVNETFPLVTFPLISNSVENFIVIDENPSVPDHQRLLDYKIEDTNLTVFTLGTTNVSVQYSTSSLTLKDTEEWTFHVDTQYNLTVYLPEYATILGLSGTPTSIDSKENRIVLNLLPGQWNINYVFPLTPPAESQISNLEVTPTEVKKGEDVKVTVKITNIGGQSGTFVIPFIINQTIEENRTLTLGVGESINTTFRITKQTAGIYIVKIDDLETIFTVKTESLNDNSSNIIQLEYLLFIGGALGTIFVVWIFYRKRRINILKIFKNNPQLNSEEKEVITFIANNEGKAFESQIREQFPNIPRTSLWRLVKRLEKLEIIDVKKIGLENQVELRK
ncbi:hypothetical protein KJN74_04400 [Candidatus Bathyarchaeota archaeon]|nr:hypothetical protein [Candidatus Bathyarchaeota archaeon]